MPPPVKRAVSLSALLHTLQLSSLSLSGLEVSSSGHATSPVPLEQLTGRLSCSEMAQWARRRCACRPWSRQNTCSHRITGLTSS